MICRHFNITIIRNGHPTINAISCTMLPIITHNLF